MFCLTLDHHFLSSQNEKNHAGKKELVIKNYQSWINELPEFTEESVKPKRESA
jgi:hypothetical protein